MSRRGEDPGPVPAAALWRLRGPVHTGRWWRGGRVLTPAPAPALPLLLAQDQCCHLSWPSRVFLGLGFVQQTLLCPHPHQDSDLVTDISSSESSCCVDVYEVSRNNAFGWYGMLHGSRFVSEVMQRTRTIECPCWEETKLRLTQPGLSLQSLESLQTQSSWSSNRCPISSMTLLHKKMLGVSK